jgi:hypothetical protein
MGTEDVKNQGGLQIDKMESRKVVRGRGVGSLKEKRRSRYGGRMRKSTMGLGWVETEKRLVTVGDERWPRPAIRNNCTGKRCVPIG